MLKNLFAKKVNVDYNSIARTRIALRYHRNLIRNNVELQSDPDVELLLNSLDRMVVAVDMLAETRLEKWDIETNKIMDEITTNKFFSSVICPKGVVL